MEGGEGGDQGGKAAAEGGGSGEEQMGRRDGGGEGRWTIERRRDDASGGRVVCVCVCARARACRGVCLNLLCLLRRPRDCCRQSAPVPLRRLRPLRATGSDGARPCAPHAWGRGAEYGRGRDSQDGGLEQKEEEGRTGGEMPCD